MTTAGPLQSSAGSVFAGAYWYIACRSSRVRPGRAVAATIAGTPLALFRGTDGAVRVLEDRCLHRNAPLSQGRVAGDGVACRYHGWEYGFDGALRRIPALAGACPSPPAPVRTYPCLEQDGYVWVCVHDRPPAAAPLRFPFLGQPGWTSFRMRTEFEAGVEACLENFLDCPHAVFVHDRWFRARRDRPVRVVVRTLDDGAEAEFYGEPRSGSVVWRVLFLERGEMRHVDRFIAPATSRVDYELPSGLHYVITSSCTPVAADRTVVHTVISFRMRFLGALVKLYFRPLARLIIEQDRRMLRAVQRNIDRFGGPRFFSSDADLLGKWIARWRAALRDGTAAPPPGQTEELVVHL